MIQADMSDKNQNSEVLDGLKFQFGIKNGCSNKLKHDFFNVCHDNNIHVGCEMS